MPFNMIMYTGVLVVSYDNNIQFNQSNEFIVIDEKEYNNTTNKL